VHMFRTTTNNDRRRSKEGRAEGSQDQCTCAATHIKEINAPSPDPFGSGEAGAGIGGKRQQDKE